MGLHQPGPGHYTVMRAAGPSVDPGWYRGGEGDQVRRARDQRGRPQRAHRTPGVLVDGEPAVQGLSDLESFTLVAACIAWRSVQGVAAVVTDCVRGCRVPAVHAARSSVSTAAHPLFRVTPGTLLVGAGLPGAPIVRSLVTARPALARRGESGDCGLVSNSMSRDVAMVSIASAVGVELEDRRFGMVLTLGRCGCRPLSSHCPCRLRYRPGVMVARGTRDLVAALVRAPADDDWRATGDDGTRQGRANHSR
jgi:hypothetical protein